MNDYPVKTVAQISNRGSDYLPRLSKNLHLPDVDIVEGVDSLAGLLNVQSHSVWDQLAHDILQVRGSYLAADDVTHLLANLTNLEKE
jgi:hypothetical protein